jgi:hypothetical protein
MFPINYNSAGVQPTPADVLNSLLRFCKAKMVSGSRVLWVSFGSFLLHVILSRFLLASQFVLAGIFDYTIHG